MFVEAVCMLEFIHVAMEMIGTPVFNYLDG